MLRQPAVAGRFYPGTPGELEKMLAAMLPAEAGQQPALMAVSPHAGYMFSGNTAGKVLGGVKITDKVVIVGPNHNGLGGPAAICLQGAWRTPLGDAPLCRELGLAVMERCSFVVDDPKAHIPEHSLEVQVPFLQKLNPAVQITPITVSGLRYRECEELGRALAGAVKAMGEPVLLVASTDMTHYEHAEKARQKDQAAIERILDLDPKGLYQTVTERRITMCGVFSTTVCLVAALELGASRAELVEYTHSGVVTGDNQQVVGYAGLVVS